MEYSVEFHGTICHLKWLLPSSVKLWYLIWRLQSSKDCYRKCHGFPGKPRVIQISNNQILWNSMEFGDMLFYDSRVHWIFHENPMEPDVDENGVPKVQWNSLELDDIFDGTKVLWNIPSRLMSLQVPWNYHGSMEFHGTSQLGATIPWCSMEFGDWDKFHETFEIP